MVMKSDDWVVMLVVFDATCPLVTKVHLEAIRFARMGYEILLVGHAGHEEVEGTTGEAPDNITLVQHPDDVDGVETAVADEAAATTAADEAAVTAPASALATASLTKLAVAPAAPTVMNPTPICVAQWANATLALT